MDNEEKIINEQENEIDEQIENVEEEIQEQEETAESEQEETIEDIEKSLREEIEKLNDRLMRSMAEFDNFRKRTIKEKSNMYDDGIRNTIEKMLPVLDNLERAIISAENEQNVNSGLKQGIEMTLRQFIEILTSMGVKEIEAQDKQFDPKFHMAVAHVEDENYEANTIIEVLQKGYIYKDKVIRYSTVKVAN